jgi:hypothetical protein
LRDLSLSSSSSSHHLQAATTKEEEREDVSPMSFSQERCGEGARRREEFLNGRCSSNEAGHPFL